jgi:bacteriocin-like protein
MKSLTRLDAQTLAKQEMTDQELKAVEGGWVVLWLSNYYGVTSGLSIDASTKVTATGAMHNAGW